MSTSPHELDDRLDEAPRRVWLTIAGREISLKVRDKAFLISIALTVVSIAGALGAATVLGDRQEKVSVAVADPAAVVLVERAQSLADDGLVIETLDVADDAAAEAAVEEGDAQLGVVDGGSGLVGRGTTDSAAAVLLQQVHADLLVETNARDAGVEVADLFGGEPLAVQEVREGQLSDGGVRLAAIALAIGFYLCALMFGAIVAQSVLEEKQNRIVEIVASLVPLRSLLVGKVVGSAVVASLQVGVIILAVVVLLAVAGPPIELPQLGLAGIWFALYFAVGYLAVAGLWAMAGALATRQEDLQHTATPVSTLLIVVVPVGLFLSGPWLAVASYVPITSVVAMPTRVLSGDAAWWEPVVALGVLGLFSFAITDFAARVYRRSLMQTRQRMTVRQALRVAD